MIRGRSPLGEMEFEQIGKYKIISEIGQGAMGVVYKAHDPILNRHVAIKTISASLGTDDDLRKRFHREAQAAARLNHPNIITVFDFGEEHGKIYMAMELLEGTDLKDVMTSGQLATLEDKLAIMEQILDGLAFAHAKEIVHRDLKPGNIHIQPNGQIKIMDFGLARLGSSEMTQAGVVMGTPNYMSPEQVLGEKVDSRSDIFAMGAVFYELLTTHKPFEAESMHGVLFQVVHKEPQPIRKWAPDLPPVLVQIVEKCLIKDKNKRFQNAGEMRDVMMAARQALVAGRISELTLDMESGKVFSEAEEFEEEGSEDAPRPKSWPPQKRDGQWVEGTVALDQAPLEDGLDQPGGASKSHPTLSGRNRTAVNRQRTQRGMPVAPPPSRAPMIIGGAIVAVGLVIAGVIFLRKPPVTVVPGEEWTNDPIVLMLLDQTNEIAQGALEDKDYKKAIDKSEAAISLARNKHAPSALKQFVQAQKIKNDAQRSFTAIETTASDAEDAFKAGNLELAATKLTELIQLDSKHPVAKKLSPMLDQQFKKEVEGARTAMQQARDQQDKVNSLATGELRASGREDLGKATTAATEAEASLKSKTYAQATRQFLEARDAFDKSRRAIETAMSEAAKKNADVAKKLKEPAEDARKTMLAVRDQAEKAGAAASPAGKDEFNNAVALVKTAEAAMSKAEPDYPSAKRAFDDARIAFDRSRRATLATPPPQPSPAPSKEPVTPSPIPSPAGVPSPVTPKDYGPPVGRLLARTGDRTNLRNIEVDKNPTSKKLPEVAGTLEFEVQPDRISLNQPYTLKIFVNNTGDKPWKLKSLTAIPRKNAQNLPMLSVPLKATDAPKGEKTLIAEITGTWEEAATWTLTATATTDKGDLATNVVAFTTKLQ